MAEVLWAVVEVLPPLPGGVGYRTHLLLVVSAYSTAGDSKYLSGMLVGTFGWRISRLAEETRPCTSGTLGKVRGSGGKGCLQRAFLRGLGECKG